VSLLPRMRQGLAPEARGRPQTQQLRIVFSQGVNGKHTLAIASVLQQSTTTAGGPMKALGAIGLPTSKAPNTSWSLPAVVVDNC
jgi:hypothetical protein